jgi:S1-C subfamily serine protease
MKQAFWLVAMLVTALISGTAAAQQSWVQIEARSSLAEAEARARAYAGVFPNVNGFAMTTGWYAIALGPFAPDEAARQLQVLRGERLIPGDSYVSDGDRFVRQFWPVGAALGATPPAAVAATPEVVVPAPVLPADEPEETLRQARASEAALTTEERELLQTALQWQGFYSGAIDGAFGAGTRRSMASWQVARGYEQTGVLTTRQRAALIDGFQEDQAALGLAPLTDDNAGIAIELPTQLIIFDRYEPPFAHFDEKNGSGYSALLISQPGDQATLYGLYDVMQTLQIVPLQGDRQLNRTSFVLTGQNATLHSYTQAELRDGLIKGFTLVWKPEDAARAAKVLEVMKASFQPVGDRALNESLGADISAQRPDLLAGLEIRRPALSRSGFYIAADGTALTTTEVLDNCRRITIDEDHEADVAFEDRDLGLAVLKPREALAAPGFAAFATVAARLKSDVAVAGYSYEDAIDAPVMTFGTLAELRGLSGEETLARLTLKALPGDAGGPVLDASGSVLGMLMPRVAKDGKVLPGDVAFALDSGAIAARLAAAGMPPSASDATGALAPEDIGALGRAMTVLVSCWK